MFLVAPSAKCLRCGGNLFFEEDGSGTDVRCLSCSRSWSLATLFKDHHVTDRGHGDDHELL